MNIPFKCCKQFLRIVICSKYKGNNYKIANVFSKGDKDGMTVIQVEILFGKYETPYWNGDTYFRSHEKPKLVQRYSKVYVLIPSEYYNRYKDVGLRKEDFIVNRDPELGLYYLTEKDLIDKI